MTSTVRRCRSSGGFTLLEIIITLTIASIVIAGALGVMKFSSDDRDLRVAATEIEVLAKRARAAAILHQTPYAVEFTQGMVRLLPLAELIGQGVMEAEDPFGEGGQSVASAHSSYAMEGGMQLAIRRWNARGWDVVDKDVAHVWRFDPDGLCEPLGLQLQVGENLNEYEFHPLTATLRNLSAEIE